LAVQAQAAADGQVFQASRQCHAEASTALEAEAVLG